MNVHKHRRVHLHQRINKLDDQIRTIEDNALLVGYIEYQISAAKKIFDPGEKLKVWEDPLKKRIEKQDDTK